LGSEGSDDSVGGGKSQRPVKVMFVGWEMRGVGLEGVKYFIQFVSRAADSRCVKMFWA